MLTNMDSQNILNNFGFVQQPVTVGSGITSLPTTQFLQQPTLYPSLVPAPLALPTFVPQLQQQNPVFNFYENIPGNADFYILTSQGMTKASPSQYCNFRDGKYHAPEGWTLLPTEEYFKYGFNVVPFPGGDLTPFDTTPSPSRSPSLEPNVFTPRDLNTERPVEPKEESGESKKVNPKRPHRAKQIKIMKIRTLVKDQCVNRGIYAEENEEFLRGEDVLRIHVKTWEALDLIEDVLEEVEESVPIARIALPFSMKNKFQKKGFICYLKVAALRYVDVVKAIFAKYPAFKKCDVALPKPVTHFATEGAPVRQKAEEPIKAIFAPSDFGFPPPTMAKRMSAA